MNICSVPECMRNAKCKGLCTGHYEQARRGVPFTEIRPWRNTRTATERFWAKVDKTGDCWVWTAAISQYGYGHFRQDGRNVRSHRAAYELTKGPIPNGLYIDHTCHNRACVNPEHLRLATAKQNTENLGKVHGHNGTSGIRGVAFDGHNRKWLVTVGHNGRRHYGGRFSNLEEAEAAAIALRNRLFTHNDMDRKAE